jgi:hypothetical protein
MRSDWTGADLVLLFFFTASGFRRSWYPPFRTERERMGHPERERRLHLKAHLGFFDCGKLMLLALVGLQDFLAQAQGLRRYFYKFVFGDELDGLF